MNLEKLKNSGRIFYKTIAGSHAYGTNTPVSDKDIKGFFWVPPREYLTLNPPVTPQDGQINDEKHDVTFYSLYRAFELLSNSNPNVIELLWMPKDCVIFYDKFIMPTIWENRHLFISKKACQTHAGYAKTQIKKAKGKNKKVHNPSPKEPPSKEDFCKIIPLSKNYEYKTFSILNEDLPADYFPFRPVPLSESEICLPHCHAASLEHVPNVYRLYDYGKQAKGVFRGDGMLCCQSIPKYDEWKRFVGLLIYDKNEYDKAVKDWHSYWTWRKERNENRWVSQENKKIDYDVKNMQHCFRLLLSGLNIMENHEPLVRMEGEKLKLLRNIREEKYTYERLMGKLEQLEECLSQSFSNCSLPEELDYEKINDLYCYLMENKK